MNFNLLDKLTQEDRIKIEKYIELYGTKKNFIGIDEWLKYWSVNKIKMYKLLGNQLTYRTSFEYNKSEGELGRQISDLVTDSTFPNHLNEWMTEHFDLIPSEVRDIIQDCCRRHILIVDEVLNSTKFKLEGEKKIFQIQKGQKPMRVIGRFLNYCKKLDRADELIKEYEDFRLAHSMILNDKIIKGNMVISIHPLDYMTMSDNDSNWSSCMSWKELGCYREGTVEMLNSNNVLCCYIENKEPYHFFEKDENSKYIWNNKKWRQLVYFTKDIIVSGKSYPYSNDEVSKILIEIIRKLAKENLNWTYSFGPERYLDMQYINGSYSMDRARGYIKNGYMKKHNILFDTKGMYNDMLNDSDFHYWCVRNKVKHNKIISYSGKAPCLCCGNHIIYENYEDDYNERYGNTGATVCADCLDDFYCNFCEEKHPTLDHYRITLYGDNSLESFSICSSCAENYLRKCPDCGKTMFVTGLFGKYNVFYDKQLEVPQIYIKLKNVSEEGLDKELIINELEKGFYIGDKDHMDKNFETIYPICKCRNCIDNDNRFVLRHYERKKAYFSWNREYNAIISADPQKKEDWTKYFIYNLEPVKICNGEVITN